jgi:2-methylcitrate dehydratase PrpD
VESETLMALPKYVNLDVQDHVEAASSLQYNVAVVAHRVPWGPQWQSRETLARADIREFMKKVQHAIYDRCELMRHQDLVVDGRGNLKHRPARVTVHARGRTYVQATDFARWIPNDVLECRATDDDLARKFKANADGVLTLRATEAAIEQILNLEKLADPTRLAALLTPTH